jgi:hypothetical protein
MWFDRNYICLEVDLHRILKRPYLSSLRRATLFDGCIYVQYPETSADVLGMGVGSFGKEYGVTINWKRCIKYRSEYTAFDYDFDFGDQ